MVVIRRLLLGAVCLCTIAGSLPAAEPSSPINAGIRADGCCIDENVFAPVVQPTLRFTFDFLVLDRSDADSSPLFVDTNTAAVLLDTGDLITNAEPGVRLGLVFFGNTEYDLEFIYLGMDRFGDRIQRTSSSPITYPFFGGVPVNPASDYTARYLSRLHGGEINVRARYSERTSFLLGFRFLELNEEFDIINNPASGSLTRVGAFSATDNDLYGIQIGGDFRVLPIRCSWFFTSLKAGIYHNNADVMAHVRNASGGGTLKFVRDVDQTAFVGEIMSGLLIPMGPNGEFRIGYHGLFLEGVGLAPNQSDNFSVFTNQGSLDTSTVSYHGIFIGFDLYF